MSYKLGSLFDGSGGFPLAGTLCGIEPRWAAEVEPYPIAVTRSRFPNMRHLGDINRVNGWEIEPVDVITFGSPCQDLSVAGKRSGLKHESKGDGETTRSGLFMEAVRIIKEMRGATNGQYPTFAIWENVPGAFSSNKGEDFRTVLEELIRIKEPYAVMPPVPAGGWAYADCYRGDGWSLAYRVFDAQYWGVPQRRRRIHLVVDFGGQRAREVLFEREGVRGYFTTGRTPWESIAPAAEGGIGTTDQTGRGRLDHVKTNPQPYTLKIRSGCDGGGKGALIQEDKSATLATNNDQYLFAPVILDDQGGQQIQVRTDGKCPTLRAEMHGHPPCVLSIGFKAGQSKAGGLGWQEGVAQTLSARASGLEPTIVCKVWDARGNEDGEKVSTITGDHESRITDYTNVLCLQGNTVDRAVCQNGAGIKENVSFTLNTTDRHAVVFRRLNFDGYKNDDTASTLLAMDCKSASDLVCGVDCRNMTEYPELYPTLQAKPNGGQSLNFSGAVRVWYIVRRLTPTECTRLQGFADNWGEIDKKDEFTQEEYLFWLTVRNTHAAINGKATKDYTKSQMLTWYNKLPSDGAKYKMWGNGIALPPALYCLQGIADALDCDDDWMN